MTYSRNEEILRVEALGVTYDRPILRDVNISVRNLVRPDVSQGQVVSIIGRSGIGKSQLFRCMAGLQQPTAGRVLMGQTLRPVRSGEVGVVPQDYVLFRRLTVEGQLRIAIQQSDDAFRNDTAAVKSKIAHYAAEFNLTDHLKKYKSELSGGQRQRVSILQQILVGNLTILLDEPFSGLDAIMLDKVLDLLRKVSLLHELQTLVLVSHDVESALAISDTVYVLGMEMTAGNGPDEMVAIPGATITNTVDLAERGLAFDPEIRRNPVFTACVREVKAMI